MLLRTIIASTVAFALFGISTNRPSTPAACTLVTAQEASTAAGAAVMLAPNVNVTSPNCQYYGAGGPAALGVAIAMHAYADNAAAHVKIGVHPPVGDAALTTLATKAISRM